MLQKKFILTNMIKYILCAEDNLMNQPFIAEVITERLHEHFELRCINKGQDCLDDVAEKSSGLILSG